MKFLKWAFLAITISVLLVVGIVGLAVATLDPNDYKNQISAKVLEVSGRNLDLEGDIRWSLFPWLGLNLGKSSLSNAEGFGDQPFASLEEIDVQVALMPLLKKQVVAKKVVLRGARLSLQKSATGTDNWSDLAQRKSPDESAEIPIRQGKAQGAAMDIDIQGIEIVNARLSYDDQQAKQNIVINDLNLSTSSLKIAAPVKLVARFKVKLNDLQAAVDLAGEIQANPDTGEYRVSDLVIHQALSGPGIPGGDKSAVARMSIEVNTETQVLGIENLSVDLQGIELQGKLQFSQWAESPRYSGAFSTNTFNLRQLLSHMSVELPDTAKSDALGSTSINFDFRGENNNLAFKPLVLKLDESRLEGSASIADINRQAIEFDLVMDRINMDHYLPKHSTATPVPAADPPTGNEAEIVELPIDMLRKLDIDGNLRIDELTVNKLHFQRANITLNAKNGVIGIAPLSAEIYGGKATINARLDARKDTPAYSTTIDMNGVQSGDILQSLFDDRMLSGTATLSANLSTSGMSVPDLTRALSGSVQTKFSEGTIKGSKLSAKILEARNFVRKLEGKEPLENKITDDTRFSILTATANIKNGQLSNSDLSLVAPLFHAKGNGSVDLPGKTLDYTLNLGRPPKEGEENFYAPLKISGPFNDLGFKLALDDVAKDYAKEELRKEEAELKARADQEKARLKQKAEEEKAKLQAQAKAKEAELKEKAQEKVEEKKSDLEDKLKRELGKKLEGLLK